MGKTAFVTVGTTLFESLIETVTNDFVLEQLMEHGFTKLVIQYGKGKRPTIVQQQESASSSSSKKLQIECYDFKPSLLPDLQAADLIISHAGAGTLMEATSLLKNPPPPPTTSTTNNENPKNKEEKKNHHHRTMIIIVAVINTILMDNHQTELAYALRDTGCICVMDTASDLLQPDRWPTIMTCWQPTAWRKGDDDDVPRILNHFFGFPALDNSSHKKDD
jgi:UDP-N-acetylglucosamine transferase subunit ALG13